MMSVLHRQTGHDWSMIQAQRVTWNSRDYDEQTASKPGSSPDNMHGDTFMAGSISEQVSILPGSLIVYDRQISQIKQPFPNCSMGLFSSYIPTDSGKPEK